MSARELEDLVSRVSLGEREAAKVVKVIVDGKMLKWDREVLRDKSDFFKALFAFDQEEEEEDECEISLDKIMSKETAETIFECISGAGRSPIDASNASEVLEGAAYLGCPAVEEICSSVLTKTLSLANCMEVLILGTNTGCAPLIRAAEAFIHKHLRTFIFRDAPRPRDILEMDSAKLRKLLDRVSNNLLAYSIILGWTKFEPEKRSGSYEQLINDFVIVELLPSFESMNIKSFEDLSVRYRSLSFKEKLAYWEEENRLEETKCWPRMSVVCSTGSFYPNVICFGDGPPGESKWTKITSKPQALKSASAGSTVVSVGGSIYFIGGHGNLSLWKYDTVYDSWKLVCKEMPSGERLCSAAAASEDGEIYIFGGYTDRKTSSSGSAFHETVDCFDTRTMSWTGPLMPMENPNSGAQAFAFGYKIYLFGGLRERSQDAGAGAVTKCVAYDIDTDTYEHVTELPRMVVHFGLTVVGSKVYLAGGVDPLTLETLKGVLCFDLVNRTWDLDFPDLRVARRNCALFFNGTTLVAAGGSGGALADLVSSEKFSVESWKWEMCEVGLPKNPRFSLAVTSGIKVPLRLMEEYRELGRSNFRLRAPNKTAS